MLKILDNASFFTVVLKSGNERVILADRAEMTDSGLIVFADRRGSIVAAVLASDIDSLDSKPVPMVTVNMTTGERVDD